MYCRLCSNQNTTVTVLEVIFGVLVVKAGWLCSLGVKILWRTAGEKKTTAILITAATTTTTTMMMKKCDPPMMTMAVPANRANRVKNII